VVYRTVLLTPQQRSVVVHQGRHDFLVGLSVLFAIGFAVSYGFLFLPVAAVTLLAAAWIRGRRRP
jgi:hypothetical protein